MEEHGEATAKKRLNPEYISKAANKPKIGDLILEAIREDGDKRGTSLALVKKYIQSNYPEFDLIRMKRNILQFIRKGLVEGSLKSKNSSVTARLKIVGDRNKPRSEKKAVAPKKDKPKKVIVQQEVIIPSLGESSKTQPMIKQRKRKLLDSGDKQGAPNGKVKVARKKIRKSMTVVQPPKTPKASKPKPGTSAAAKRKAKAAKTAKDPKKPKAPKKAKDVAKQAKEMAEEP